MCYSIYFERKSQYCCFDHRNRNAEIGSILIRGHELNFAIKCVSLFYWLLYVAFKTSNPRERSVAVGQVFIDFEENSSSRNYLVFDDAYL